MKEVIFKKKDENTIIIDNFDQMIARHSFIGFVPNECPTFRFILISGGAGRGLAVRPGSTWTDRESQKRISSEGGIYGGKYYIFNNEKTLYEWLLEPY